MFTTAENVRTRTTVTPKLTRRFCYPVERISKISVSIHFEEFLGALTAYLQLHCRKVSG